MMTTIRQCFSSFFLFFSFFSFFFLFFPFGFGQAPSARSLRPRSPSGCKTDGQIPAHGHSGWMDDSSPVPLRFVCGTFLFHPFFFFFFPFIPQLTPLFSFFPFFLQLALRCTALPIIHGWIAMDGTQCRGKIPIPTLPARVGCDCNSTPVGGRTMPIKTNCVIPIIAE